MILLLRAWLPKEKRMLHHNEISLTEGRVFERIYDDRTGYINSFEKKNAILMISLGLKDRNAVPIFNGDIVKRNSPFGEFIGEAVIHKGVTQFKTCKYGISYSMFNDSVRYQDGYASADVPQEYEKLGNIYENPVLLIDYPELLEKQ